MLQQLFFFNYAHCSGASLISFFYISLQQYKNHLYHGKYKTYSTIPLGSFHVCANESNIKRFGESLCDFYRNCRKRRLSMIKWNEIVMVLKPRPFAIDNFTCLMIEKVSRVQFIFFFFSSRDIIIRIAIFPGLNQNHN